MPLLSGGAGPAFCLVVRRKAGLLLTARSLANYAGQRDDSHHGLAGRTTAPLRRGPDAPAQPTGAERLCHRNGTESAFALCSGNRLGGRLATAMAVHRADHL